MEARKLTCPGCGAHEDIPADLSRGHCVYCGSTLLVERADEGERESVEIHLELGRTALEADNCQEALEHFSKALEADRNNARAWIGKARATRGLSTPADDKLYEALRYIDDTLELEAGSVAARRAKEEIKHLHSR